MARDLGSVDSRCDQGTVGRWREQRLTAIRIFCDGFGRCGRYAEILIDPAWPDDLDMREVRRRLVCRCGQRYPRIMPDWANMRDPPEAWDARHAYSGEG